MPRNLGFLETFPVVPTLPTSAGSGRVVTLSTDGHPYFDHSTGWIRLDLPSGVGDMLKSAYDHLNRGIIDTNALGTGTANSGSFLRGDNTWSSAMPPSPTGTTDPFRHIMGRLYNGNVAGQDGWSLGASSTGTVSNAEVSVTAPWNTSGAMVAPARRFSTGILRFVIKAGSASFMLGFGLSDAAPLSFFAVWCGGGAAGNNVEFGWNSAGALTSKIAGPAVLANEDTVIEVIYPGPATGNTVQVRAWGVSANRPAAASETYTFVAGDPAYVGDRLGLKSITGTAIYREMTVDDVVTNLRETMRPTGFWFPQVVGGKTYLATINTGSIFDFNTLGADTLTLNCYQASTSALPTRLAISIDDGPFYSRTLTSTGDQNLLVATGLGGVPRHIQIIVGGLNESNAVWNGTEGFLLSGITLDAGMTSRPAENALLIQEYGDSITPGTIANGNTGGSTPANFAGEYAYPMRLARLIGHRMASRGFGGTGASVSGSGGVPKLSINAVNYTGVIAMHGEEWPRVLRINIGTNDGSQTVSQFQFDLTAAVTALQTRYPGTPIVLIRPLAGTQATTIAAVATALGCTYVDTNNFTGITFTDGIHPDKPGHNRFAELLVPSTRVALGTPTRIPTLIKGQPPVLDAQSSLFSRLANGSISGQQGFVTAGASTGTVAGPLVSVVGNFSNQADYVLTPREFTTGVLRFQTVAGANGNFMFNWGVANSGLTAGQFGVWSASGAVGANIEFGYMTYNPVLATTSLVLAAGVVPAGRYTIEVTFRGQTAGSITEIRVWAETANRPITPTLTYTFTGSEPAITGTRVALRGISTNAVTYTNLEVQDAISTLRSICLPSGYWFPYVYGGKSALVSINQGSRLDFVVQNTLNFTVNVTGHSAATYQPKIAFKIDGGPVVYRTVPGTGAQALSIALPDSGLHRVAFIVAGVHETDNVWTDAEGLLVNSVSVDPNGTISRPSDDRGLLAVFGDSITAGIVTYGVNATAPVSTPSQSGGDVAYPAILAQRLNMRVTGHGFGGTGITVGGNGSVPKALLNVFGYQANLPLYGEDAPTLAVINENTNDAAQTAAQVATDYLAFIDALRARYPGLRIVVMRPLNGNQGPVNAAVAAARGCTYVDTTGWTGVTFADGTHPDPPGHNRVAELLAGAVTNAPAVVQVTSVTTTYTIAASDGFLKADATAAAFTVTLPSASSYGGRSIPLKKIDATTNAVTFAAVGTQTVEGAANFSLTAPGQAVTIYSDGTNWMVI